MPDKVGSSAGAPAKKAIKFFACLSQEPADHGSRGPEQEQATFEAFCKRFGFVEDTSFVVNGVSAADGHAAERQNGDASPVDWQAGGYAALRRYVRQRGDVGAVVIRQLEDLHCDREELALMLLEMEGLGARVFLANGKAVEAYSIVAGTWPESVAPPADLGDRIKSAMRKHAIKGEGLGKPPYGYRIGPRRRLEVVPEEADVVRLVFSLYTQQDQGIRLIVRHLNANAMLTRKGRNWSMVTIRDILRNRAYLGTYTRFGLRVPGSHPAIITPDMFRWAQARMEARRPQRTSAQADPFVLSGFVYCGDCGNRMVGVTRRQAWVRRKDGSRQEKEYRYYQCQSRTNQGVCTYHTQQAEELEQRLLEYLQGERSRLGSLKGVRDPLASPAAVLRQRRKLRAACEKLDQRLKRSIRLVQAGKHSLQRFRAATAGLLQSRRETLQQLDGLE
ncbi:MAG: recombinase family protein, partial [Chloroflexi bacterium]|nr:recombinase family protein [Chloroflexota bacterium]